MKINSLCNTCFQSYELLIEASDIDLLRQITDESGHTAKCPRLCGGTINVVGDRVISEMTLDRRIREPMQISGKELYRAVNGMGLRDEIPLSKDVVEMLLNTQLRSFELDMQDGKIYLTELKFEGGRTLHLTSGARGAQVLKITKAEMTETPR